MIFGSSILEVAIGMALVYVLLSLICSAVNEWFSGIVHLRAKFLRKGVANLLNDPVINQIFETDLVENFFKHPLVKGLADAKQGGQPSYIPAQTFARVLIDLMAKAGVQNSEANSKPRSLLEIYQTARSILTDPKAQKSELGNTLLLLLDEAGVDPQKIENAREILQKLKEARQKLLGLAENGGANAPAPELMRALLDNIREMEASAKQIDADVMAALQKAQQNIENYFDEAMERVTGWYKRRVQLIIVGLGLFVTLLLNVDSLAIANSLITNPAQRAFIVDAAVQNQSALAAMVAPTNTQSVSVTTDLALAASPPLTTTQPITAPLKLLQGLGLPMGWQQTTGNTKEWIWKGWSWWDWSAKLVGLLITTAAISQGAPFWFDLLSLLLNLRMTGKKPEKTAKQT